MTVTSTPPAPAAPVARGIGPGAGAAGVLGAFVVAGLLAAVTVALTGAAAPDLLADAGPLVRWGLPVTAALGDLCAALSIGCLVLATVALPVRDPGRDARGRRRPPLAFAPALTAAGAAAFGWAVLGGVHSALSYADLAGISLADPQFGRQWWFALHGIDLGREQLWEVSVAVLVATCAVAARTLRAAGLITLLALSGLVPPALAGHSAQLGGHETAVTSLGLHLLGVTVWAGGLLALLVLSRSLAARELTVAVARWSPLALVGLVLVAASGLVNAAIRVPLPEGLDSAYAAVVVAKLVAVIALGGFGWWHRRVTMPALREGRPRAFARLAAVEALVMAAAVGLGAGLSRTAPPAAGAAVELSRVESLTGYPLPPPITFSRWFTVWQPDLLWVVVTALMAGLYLAGAVRLHRRGDRWPVGRTITWLCGVAVVVWVTCAGPAAYGRTMFSTHMVGHMTLSMVAPLLLVLGAPVTLALRALRPRADGTRGPREWLLAVVESRWLRVMSHPVVAGFLFAGSLIGFYYSPLFGLALRTHVGHELMHVHFLAAGYVFAWVLIGVDPGPARPPYPLRLLVLFATMAFHSFFGISLLGGTTVLEADWFGQLVGEGARTWGRGLLADQRYGGGLAWGLGEIPTVALAIVMAVQWAMSDDREARRRDRAADRDGDAELVAYNRMLAGLAENDARREG
ncbi:MAG: cytochrome c oxidase assembly protein [Kineosporiaceae bacterium]